ncbi:hypothetical protein [Amycolatopsis sp. CA-230715]|uniref:hypothetical protein n=1 Tax=Amycolatopsis sp. CA-230715 TaxID=2745196 RepID=UPI001C01C3E6|nr:hypothetical protein [Amycolatopsis sp. CA-230715]QWF86077.1 hypothetical protein HUW46_09558 [Amycolatopsis sp. CA-230715]
MTAATARRRPSGKTKARPVSGANFERRTSGSAKSVRKQVRKGLVRAAVTNKIADKRMAARERAEFYRNLRQLKMRRRKIADKMARLTVVAQGLLNEVQHVEDRYIGVDAGLVDETRMLAKAALSSVSAAADEWHTFSRKKVYFTEAVAAA